MSPAISGPDHTLAPAQDATGVGPLGGEWQLAALPPGSAASPAELARAAPEWIPCTRPMPVAAALRAAGQAETEPARDLDASDWWYRCRFSAPAELTRARLRFQGLATITDVWLNGAHLLHSESMFVAHDVPAEGLRHVGNELLIRCHALGPLLQARRGRGRWKTKLVASQQLRHYRTTLLGRMPGWCPPLAPVGPWRPILLQPESPVRLLSCQLQPRVEGDEGIVEAVLHLSGSDSALLQAATLTLGDSSAPCELTREADGALLLRCTVRIPAVQRWWPHTHGAQPLYSARLTASVAGESVDLPLGRVGFRDVALERGPDGEGFGLRVNDVEVFCRGACWTPLDLARLTADPAEYRAALTQARAAGMNMLRVGGTMLYEDDAFYALCDELGILVWQDFMFANLDYPTSEAAFLADVETEARQFLLRMQGRPCLAVLCGNSEVEQQAAMLGLPPATARNPIFTELLPRTCAQLAPDVPWISSTPTGGTHPFQIDRGVSHYYGVGAYLRPLEDARRAGVRFTSECLAFSNIPEPETVSLIASASSAAPTHPHWKAAVPRDPGAGWDFEDVRDFYLQQLFSVNPQEVRSADPERYLALGRVATGEVIERTLGEWRRPGSSCRGALVWLLRDVVPGAGWGLLDSTGHPKPAWWYFRRACRARAMVVSDEGLNGLFLHVLNESAEPLNAELRLTLYREGSIPVGSGKTELRVPARDARTVHADALLEGFRDLTQAYHFGPAGHDVVAAVLSSSEDGSHVASAFHWPLGLPGGRAPEPKIVAVARRVAQGHLITLNTDRVALAVSIRGNHFMPDDNYLTLTPDSPRTILLKGHTEGEPLRAMIAALHSSHPVVVELNDA